MKRFTAILLVVILAFSLSVSSFAATVPADGSISVTADASGRIFKAYQIFSAIAGDDQSAPGEVSYAYTVNPSYKEFFINLYTDLPDNASSNQIIAKVASLNTAEVRMLADALGSFIKGDTISPNYILTENSNVYSASPVALGYYIILDETDENGEQGYVPSLVMLNSTTPEIQIHAKDEFTTGDKSIVVGSAQLVNVADFNVGDIITYQISATVPETVDDVYSVYSINLSDKIDATLQYQAITSIKFDEIEIFPSASGYDAGLAAQIGSNATLTFDAATDSFSYALDLVNDNSGLNLMSLAVGDLDVVITYTVKIVSGERVGTGNENEYTLTHTTPKGTTEVYKEKNTVYTYGFMILKTDDGMPDPVPLANAEFKLTKDTSDLYFVKVDTYYLLSDSAVQGASTKLVSGPDGYIDIRGLDTGMYTLTETKAPDGYNLLNGTITVAITTPATPDGTFTIKSDDLEITDMIVDVVNAAGVQLPSTGGIGTTMFTLGGLAILFLAGAFLVVNRKKIFGK